MPQNKKTRLAQWTERIPSQTSQDPLGLANRVSQRLVNQLLFGMTVAGRRTRYYSYYTWAVHDVITRERPTNRQALEDGIYWRDVAYMAACLLHHEHEDFKINTVAGMQNGAPFVREAGDILDLVKLRHIESDGEGGFGLNFKGSILNLGLLREVLSADGQWLTYELPENAAVSTLVTSLESCIAPTAFYQKYACSRQPVPRAVLLELGTKACLCLLSQLSAPEHALLRDMLFERQKGFLPPASFRPASLRLVLHCAERCASAGTYMDERQFRCFTYYGQCYAADGNSCTAVVRDRPFIDICNRWRMFFLHHYFSIALEGLLIATLHLLEKAETSGMSVNRLAAALTQDGFYPFLCSLLSSDRLTASSSVEDLLMALFQGSPPQGTAWSDVPLMWSGSEEALTGVIYEHLEGSTSRLAAACLAVIAASLARSEALQQTPHGRWILNAVEDAQRDITPPHALLWFNRLAGSWRHLSLEAFLHHLLSRFVIEQHELMVPEKKPGTSWLRWDDGIAFFENAFEKPSPGSSRFVTAEQALRDLGLLKYDDQNIPCLTDVARDLIREMDQATGRQ